VSGATGNERPRTFKVSATYRDGFRTAGTLTIVGRDAKEKARCVGEIVLQRIGEAGFSLRDSVVETIGGTGSSLNVDECVLRIAVESESREAVERFSHELMPYITAGPQGTTGYAEGRPRVHPVFRYWPCLIDRKVVASQVTFVSSAQSAANSSTRTAALSAEGISARRVSQISQPQVRSTGGMRAPSHLYDIAIARSGDKGSGANIGVIVRNRDSWELLKSWLSAEVVAAYFAPLGVEAVERFELPNLGALNFVLRGILRRNLRTDAQGKALGQMLLEMPLPTEMISSSGLKREAT
jgi:hypothetical protein